MAAYNKENIFCLCVDDFGVKNFSYIYADHIFNTIKKYYKIYIDLEGKNFCGLTIYWNYNKEYVNISIPTYIPKALKYFLRPTPKKPCYAPHRWIVPVYGQITQYAKVPENTPPIDAKGTKDIQAKVGLLL